MNVTFAQLIAHAQTLYDPSEYLDLDELPPSLMYTLDSTTPVVTTWLQHVARLEQTDDAIVFDPMYLHFAVALADLFHAEYETPESNVLWHAFNLSGDDDVDYNGSYVSLLVDLIRSYCDANDILHT